MDTYNRMINSQDLILAMVIAQRKKNTLVLEYMEENNGDKKRDLTAAIDDATAEVNTLKTELRIFRFNNPDAYA